MLDLSTREVQTVPSNEEKLLELAFKAEKYGEREQAIRLYREVANGESEHASYAQNCAETLDRLGVPAKAKLDELASPIPDSPVSNSHNPYEAPATTQSREMVAGNSFETVSRLQISATIIRSISILCIVASVYTVFSLGLVYGNPYRLDTWTTLDLLAWFDGLTVIVLLFAARQGLKYSAALQQLLPPSAERIDVYSKPHLSFWASIGVLAVLRIARESLFLLPVLMY